MNLRATFVLAAALAAAFAGCDKVENAGRKAVRKTGDLVGKGVTEFACGVGEGAKEVVHGALPDVATAIATRRSIRRFDPSRTVGDALVEKLLRAAMAAPSAMDKRPWEIVVVRDEAKLKALAEALPSCRIGNGAKLAFCVCGTLDNGLPGRGREYWLQDCSAASQNLLLAAHGHGLGAVWTGVWPGEDRVAAVRRILEIPEGFAPLNLIPVGYPAENPAAKDKWNAAKVHYDRW
ncbi:MAG: nitroreductase family protein [Kiritimatiellae bacterium]|nr:nitroreductase family protein [Kiritimatiellia bacterium]